MSLLRERGYGHIAPLCHSASGGFGAHLARRLLYYVCDGTPPAGRPGPRHRGSLSERRRGHCGAPPAWAGPGVIYAVWSLLGACRAWRPRTIGTDLGARGPRDHGALAGHLETGADQYPTRDVPGGGKWRGGGHASLLRV